MTPLDAWLSRRMAPWSAGLVLALIYAATLLAIAATLGDGGSRIPYLDVG